MRRFLCNFFFFSWSFYNFLLFFWLFFNFSLFFLQIFLQIKVLLTKFFYFVYCRFFIDNFLL